MNNDFKDIMSKQTDEELIKIVTVNRDGYQPQAIIDAEEEIKRRSIDPISIEKIKADLMVTFEEESRLNNSRVNSLARVGHLIVDTFAIFLLDMLLSYMLGYFIVWTELELSMWLFFLVLMGGVFGYYVFMETKYQKTIGKFLTKTRVTMKDGGKPGVGDIVRRTLCRLIPFDAFSFLFTDNGFHDRLSDTTIIKDVN